MDYSSLLPEIAEILNRSINDIQQYDEETIFSLVKCYINLYGSDTETIERTLSDIISSANNTPEYFQDENSFSDIYRESINLINKNNQRQKQEKDDLEKRNNGIKQYQSYYNKNL